MLPLQKLLPDYDVKVISFGPCQTPTLALCVEQHEKVLLSQRTAGYTLQSEIELPGGGTLLIDYTGEPFATHGEAMDALCRLDPNQARIASISQVDVYKGVTARPLPLNTVGLLKLASAHLGLSPTEAMEVAQRAYLNGRISYPRTETTLYNGDWNLKAMASAVVRDVEVADWSEGKWMGVGQMLESSHPPREDGINALEHRPIVPTGPNLGRLDT